MFVVLNNGNFILNINNIGWVKWLETKNLALIRMQDGTDEWLRSRGDYDVIVKEIARISSPSKRVTDQNSNDLKATTPIQSGVTTRRVRQSKRNNQKSTKIPKQHRYAGLTGADLCRDCSLPFQHPCHNKSNPIDEKVCNKLGCSETEHTRSCPLGGF